MPKHPPSQNHLFIYEDVTERVICPNCKGIVKTVIPATSVTYLIHARGEVCILDHRRGVSDGTA